MVVFTIVLPLVFITFSFLKNNLDMGNESKEILTKSFVLKSFNVDPIYF